MNKANPTASIGVPFSVTQQPPITIRRKSPYSQALELQDLLMEEARTAKGKPMARAVVARAWRDLEDIKRRIQGKADPKPVDVAKARKEDRIAKQQAMMYGEPFEEPCEAPIPMPQSNPADY
jgi:hypothetical protein